LGSFFNCFIFFRYFLNRFNFLKSRIITFIYGRLSFFNSFLILLGFFSFK
jgi:hypothetical protein